MKLCIFCFILVIFNFCSAQSTDDKTIACIYSNFKKKGIQIDTVLNNYENYLIKKEFLQKKKKGRYLAFIQKMKKENAIIATVPLNTYLKLEKVGGENFLKNCVGSNIDLNGTSFKLLPKFVKLTFYLNDKDSSDGPAELADIFLKSFEKQDFDTEFLRLFMLLSLGWITDVDDGITPLPSFKLLPPIDNN